MTDFLELFHKDKVRQLQLNCFITSSSLCSHIFVDAYVATLVYTLVIFKYSAI